MASPSGSGGGGVLTTFRLRGALGFDGASAEAEACLLSFFRVLVFRSAGVGASSVTVTRRLLLSRNTEYTISVTICFSSLRNVAAS